MRIADAHAHIFPAELAEKASDSIGAFYEIPMANVASAEVLVAREREAGAERVLVCNSAVNAGQVAHINSFIATECRLHPEFVGLGSLMPGMDEWQEELDRIEAFGLHGIKIHSDFQHVDIDAPEAVEMYRAVAKKGMVVLFHMGDDRYDYSAPRRLLHLKRLVPDLKAIAAHFGGYQAWDASLACEMPEGIWYDTSSSLMFLTADRAKAMFDKFGTHRFLFGSDFPMWTPKTELNRFLTMELGLTEREKQAILWDNFARLFSLQSAPDVV
ncbi:MAG: amidohydrolase [Oscillospiraceae bacterium]|nr:amidohydrolase [Oscillospiraceae bacterium]